MFDNGEVLRNRLLATARFEPLDRAWRHECMGFWNETLTRWHGEGLPSEVNDMAGGYIPGIDHLLTPDVSYENSLFFRDLVRDVVDKHYGVKDG